MNPETRFFEVRMKIRHAGCYTERFAEKFPRMRIECFNTQFSRGRAVDLFHFSQDPARFAAIKEYLQSHPTIVSIDALEETPTDLYLRVVSKLHGGVKTISEVVFANDCHATKPLSFEDGCEVWSIASPDKRALSRVVAECRRMGDVTVISAKNTAFSEFLTPAQRKAVVAANVMGYYSWPRKADTRQLAAHLGVSKTALLSALRHAEAKIISRAL